MRGRKCRALEWWCRTRGDCCASREPILPRGLEHKDERLALWALRALNGKITGVDYWLQPAVGCKIWRVRERTRWRGRRA